MGGAVVTGFADRFPKQVASLVLIAPSGLPVERPLTARLLSVPGMGEIMFSMAGKQSLMKHISEGTQCADGSSACFVRQSGLKPGRGDWIVFLFFFSCLKHFLRLSAIICSFGVLCRLLV